MGLVLGKETAIVLHEADFKRCPIKNTRFKVFRVEIIPIPSLCNECPGKITPSLPREHGLWYVHFSF